MEHQPGLQYGYLNPTPQEWMYAQSFPRATTEEPERRVEDGDVHQGRIFWLPSKDDLPKGAVKRVRGKGAIEEGIYCHPVVVVSRPAENSRLAHIQLITSLQGKRLDQLYNKPTEFHASRRSWYLPIAPTPEHPDANSKKTKKRFPTLEIAEGAALRWDSYVNIRYVYEIDWSHLKVYANPDMPDVERFRFERESLIRLLAKSKLLTQYESGPQMVKRSSSEPLPAMRERTEAGQISWEQQYPRQIVAIGAPIPNTYTQWDFCLQQTEGYPILGERPDIPPDTETTTTRKDLCMEIIYRPFDRLLSQLSAGIEGKPAVRSSKESRRQRPFHQIWVDFKGVLAVLIASTM